MADERSFADMIIAQLGTPREPFGPGDLLLLAILAIAAAAWFALEYGVGLAIVRLIRGRDRSPDEPPSSGGRSL